MRIIKGKKQKGLGGLFVDESLQDITIAVDAAIAQERPPTAHLLGALHADRNHLTDFLVLRSPIKELALRTDDHRRTPELNAIGLL